MRFDCIESRLASCFASYSRIVSRWPGPFILIPLLITSVLMLGLARRPPLLKDDLTLYTPTDAPARDELRSLQHLFGITDDDRYYFDRRYDANRAGYIILLSKLESGNVFLPQVLNAAIKLWTELEAITVTKSSQHYNYSTLCVRAASISGPELCVQNPLVRAFALSPLSVSRLKYPWTENGWFLGQVLGGVEVDDQDQVLSAKALLLPYQLRHHSTDADRLAEEWELALQEYLEGYQSSIIDITYWTSETLPTEAAKDREKLINLLIPLFVVVTLFTVSCCFVADSVRSRPWLGFGGVISAAMAILSGIGVLLLSGQRFTSVAYTMPFIVFSIGVDNVFILLSAWRKTPICLKLSERMSLTFRDAGVSITVTSLTDGLSFGVGCMTSFPSVRIFCLYATVAILFVYFYQLTFFAGIMVLTGRREVAERHCITFHKVKRKVKPTKDRIEKWKHTGNHNSKSNPWAKLESSVIPNENSNHALARFFRNGFATMLLNPLVRFLIIIAFLGYLGGAAWGCTQIKLGLEPTDLLPKNSYGRKTLALQEKYFTQYGAFVHVWVRNLTSYQDDRRLWVSLQNELDRFEHTEFLGYSDSWLRFFTIFTKSKRLMITKDNFAYLVRNIFLASPPYQKYKRDLYFTEDGRHLEAVRFPIYLRGVSMANQSKAMTEIRKIAKTSAMQVQVYSDFFRFAEQYDAVLPGTLINIAVAGAAVILVSLLLIPQPLTALWVSLTIVSINVGILGYMSIWEVRLDFVSMVTIVMSIGFCVDFSAHLAYHFAKERGHGAEERLRAALYAVGTPVLQSAASTVLGVLFLIVVDSYVFRSFLKTVVLVIALGTLHGLVVLPVMLTMFHCRGAPRSNASSEEYTASGSGGSNPHLPGGRDPRAENPQLHQPPSLPFHHPGFLPPQRNWHSQMDLHNYTDSLPSVAKDVSMTYGTHSLSFMPKVAQGRPSQRPRLFTPGQWHAQYYMHNPHFMDHSNSPTKFMDHPKVQFNNYNAQFIDQSKNNVGFEPKPMPRVRANSEHLYQKPTVSSNLRHVNSRVFVRP